MKIAHFNNLNNIGQDVSFKAIKTSDFTDLCRHVKAAQKFADCRFGNIYTELVNELWQKNPELFDICDFDGSKLKIVRDDSIKRRAIVSFKTFISMPLDLVNAIAEKFPNSKFYNLEILKKHREAAQFEDHLKALQGLQNKGIEIAKKSLRKNNVTAYPADSPSCNDYCENLCSFFGEEFNKVLNNKMADDVAMYDTKKERFVTRLVSGFTAALFLGNDFYNKAIEKGKTEKEAKKEQYLKQGQEVRENICEAITQFAVFACFSKFVNSSPWAPAIVGAAIGFVSRIVSRLSSNMPIRRIAAPKRTALETPSLEQYKNYTKEGKSENIVTNTKFENDKKETKKPVLNAKNIILFCLFSIAGGYSARFIKNNTKIGREFAQFIQKHKDIMQDVTHENLYARKNTVYDMQQIANVTGEKALKAKADKILNEFEKINDSEILIGRECKKTKIFGVEVKTKDLFSLATAPFEFVKEFLFYPYKIADKLEKGIRSKLNNDAPLDELSAPMRIVRRLTDKIKERFPDKFASNALNVKDEINHDDIYEFKNIYKKFAEFEEKYKHDPEQLKEEFTKYLRKTRLMSFNEITQSKGDNSQIAVLAQTLGTLTGMWFNMNDEYNASIRNGSTKTQAEKEARLRGINKFFRMTVQVIISANLNRLFKAQYNSSIAKSALIVAASTILTDAASRIMSGMPTHKMTKEELEEYREKHKEGVMKWYYDVIDKLAS